MRQNSYLWIDTLSEVIKTPVNYEKTHNSQVRYQNLMRINLIVLTHKELQKIQICERNFLNFHANFDEKMTFWTAIRWGKEFIPKILPVKSGYVQMF